MAGSGIREAESEFKIHCLAAVLDEFTKNITASLVPWATMPMRKVRKDLTHWLNPENLLSHRKANPSGFAFLIQSW